MPRSALPSKIEHAINILNHYNLRFQQLPVGDGNYVYRLEP